MSETTDPLEAETPWVTAYRVTRHYGGPEEGGWWYNVKAKLETVGPVWPDGVDGVIKMLTNKYEPMKWGNIYSVNGGVDVVVLAEEVAGQFETKEHPHFE